MKFAILLIPALFLACAQPDNTSNTTNNYIACKTKKDKRPKHEDEAATVPEPDEVIVIIEVENEPPILICDEVEAAK